MTCPEIGRAQPQQTLQDMLYPTTDLQYRSRFSEVNWRHTLLGEADVCMFERIFLLTFLDIDTKQNFHGRHKIECAKQKWRADFLHWCYSISYDDIQFKYATNPTRHFFKKTLFPGIEIPIVKIRRSIDRHISIVGIPIPVIWRLHNKITPSLLLPYLVFRIETHVPGRWWSVG